MNALVNPVKQPVESDSLETILTAMCDYGSPHIFKMEDGWHCCIKMYVTSIGATFEVMSTYKEPSPLVAAIECRKRMDEALLKMGKAQP
jgi:hypothetical protein